MSVFLEVTLIGISLVIEVGGMIFVWIPCLLQKDDNLSLLHQAKRWVDLSTEQQQGLSEKLTEGRWDGELMVTIPINKICKGS